MVLSLLLVISPVSVAYSTLVVDSETEQSSHCDTPSQQQSKKSCCQDDQCNDNHCKSLQCHSIVQLQALSIPMQLASHIVSNLFAPALLLYGPDKDSANNLLRPPIYLL